MSILRKLFGRRNTADRVHEDIEATARDSITKMNLDDPAERAGVRLFFVLNKQLELIGKPEGNLPYVSPFASPKARGALLGTAIAIVRREYGSTPNKAVMDAAITAFTLVFGPDHGERGALTTIKEAGGGNDEINDASDWAIKDTKGGIGTDSVTTPVAYYLAVSGMI